MKVLISLTIALALAGTFPLTAEAASMEDGPDITFGLPSYTGLAPHPTYEGPIEDYVGPACNATWITCNTPITITAPPTATRIYWQNWYFPYGWERDAYGNLIIHSASGTNVVTGTLLDPAFNTLPCDDCWHKVVAWYQEDGENSTKAYEYFYVDNTAPVTTKEYGSPILVEPGIPVVAFWEDFSAPTGWTIVDSDGNGDTWIYTNSVPYWADGFSVTGDFALMDDDVFGSGSDNNNERLISPIIDCSTITGTWLTFGGEHQDMAGYGSFWCNVSANGGGTWDNVFYETADADFGYPMIDISTWADGSASVMIEFAYTDQDPGYGSGWAWGALVDDVMVGGLDLSLTGPPCITCDTPIYLNCTDGPWNVEEDMCPSGINGTWYNITNIDTGISTGWMFSPGSSTVIYVDPAIIGWAGNDTFHMLQYYQVDNMGNVEQPHQTFFYLDCTPPTCDVYVDAPVIPDDCVCCGGELQIGTSTLFFEDFEGDISDWEIRDLGGVGTWIQSSSVPFWATGFGSGAFLIIDDDAPGPGEINVDEAITPTIDCTGQSGVYLLMDLEHYTLGAMFYIEISTDNGGSWTPVYSTTADYGPGPFALALPWADGESEVKLKFGYDDLGIWDYGTLMDNVGVYGYFWLPGYYYEYVTVIIDDEPTEIEVPKQQIGDCVNFTIIVTDLSCCPIGEPSVEIEVFGPGYDPAVVPSPQYWRFDAVYNATYGWFEASFCDTDEIGVYTVVIHQYDALGNVHTETEYFLIKPLCDVDIIELLTPDPSIMHPNVPTEVVAKIKNNGILPVDGYIDVHLQIYEEMEFDLQDFWCTDAEDCVMNTFDAISWDGDPATWVWTDRKSNSPTHSWGCHPDYMATYEAYSHDSLYINNGTDMGIYIPEEIDNDTVYYAFLNFSHWCEGEEFYDFGQVFLEYSPDGLTWNQAGPLNAEPYWDTAGNWEWAGPDGMGFDISAYIGYYVIFNFTWYSDAFINYDGWYIDDICIQIQFGARQPLVYQEYKFVHNLAQNEEKLVEFPLDFTPKNDTYYYFEVYSNLCGDIDGPADMNFDWVIDPRTTFPYKDPWNGVNESLYFGDVCDAAITAISAPAQVEMPDDGTAEIPIDVTVCNTGTLTKDVPVQVGAYPKVYETLIKDDFEGYDPSGPYYISSEDSPWNINDFGSGPAEWNITDYEFYSPFNSLGFMDSGHHYGAGHLAYIWYDMSDVDFAAYADKDVFDVKGKIKWNLGNADYVCPAIYCGTWLRLISGNFTPGPSGGWVEFSLAEAIEGYIERDCGDDDDIVEPEETNYNNIYCETNALMEEYGGDWDLFGWGFAIIGEDWYNTLGEEAGSEWSGVMIDDFELYTEYASKDPVWTSEIQVVEGLEQGDCEDLTFWWNTSLYCDYILKAEVLLDCDQNESNNNKTTPTRIYEQIYEDDWYDDYELDDNTCDQPDNWDIVQECSMCPNDHFWYSGLEDGLYDVDQNDCLFIDEVFNFSGSNAEMLRLTFDTYYDIETNYDFGYIEVSNDSGLTWYTIDALTGGNGGWETLSYTLDATTNTPMLTSPYTGFQFDFPSDFFTEDIHIRFRFTSDDSVVSKGWFLDNVILELYNGTWNEMFSDDMEDGDAKWDHMMCCSGNHWHEETMIGDGPTPMWFWNGEARSYFEQGLGIGYYREYWGTTGTGAYPAPDWTSEWGPLDSGNGGLYTWGSPPEYQDAVGFLQDGSGSPAFVDIYYNSTGIAAPNYPYVELNIGAFNYGEFPHSFDVTVTDGTDTVTYPFTIPDDVTLPHTFVADITTPFAGDTIDISIHCADTYGYFTGTFFDWVIVQGISTGASLPYQNYYNNVDEKIIFEFDLTKAYQAIFTWMQNYSFAGQYDHDYGLVDIWTDGDWKTLFIVQGSSGGVWTPTTLDISEYVGGAEPTKMRFRFVSNGTLTDLGWMIDNFDVQGKLDHEPPEIMGALDPTAPSGCNGWYNGPVTVKLTATDNIGIAAIYYRIDGGVWLQYNAPFQINVDGSHTIDYYAEDIVGNQSPYGALTFKIDATNPTGSLTAPQAGYIYLFGRELMPRLLIKDKALIIGGFTATATASDATAGVDYVTFTTGAGSSSDAVPPYEFNLPFYFPFGSDTLTISITDEACNTATNVASVDYMKIL
jgi:hypothetical protein